MTKHHYEAFCAVIGGFAEIKGKQLSEAAIELYWRSMQHWNIDDFRVAAEHLLRTCEFFPTPADFEKLYHAGRPTAAEAWAMVLAHIKGPYRDGRGIDDGGPIDQAVAGLGGYKALAFCDTAYMPQRQFVERYAEQADVDRTREQVPAIADVMPRLPTMGPW